MAWSAKVRPPAWSTLVADEFDTMSEEALDEILDLHDPVGSLVRIVHNYEATPDENASATPLAPQSERSPWRRVRYFFQEPSVRMAFCATLDRAGQRIAPLMARTGELTEIQARVAANALVFGYFAALEQWYLDGGTQPIATYVEDGLAALRPIWSPVAGEPA